MKDFQNLTQKLLDNMPSSKYLLENLIWTTYHVTSLISLQAKPKIWVSVENYVNISFILTEVPLWLFYASKQNISLTK